MDILLTEAHWKKNGLPLRSIKEKLSQSKTGISEALRAADAADKALRAEILNADLVKKMDKALDAVTKTLTALKAADKKLLTLRDKMLQAVKGYRADHNAMLLKINRATIGGLPGGLKMLQKQGEKEFSTENQQFFEGAMKISSDPVKIVAFVAANISAINIPNEPKWRALIKAREDWEKDVKLELKKALEAVVSNQNDTINRLRNECHL